MKSCLITALLGLLLPWSVAAQSAETPPNIVLVLIDDSGLMDLGAFGGEAHTPTIDSLAGQGQMYTNLHASPVCAPSRAMLLTGTDSHLAGVANLPEMLPESYQQLPGYEGVLNDGVQTIATRLKERDYRTYVTGKWHLGHDENTLPVYRGFDRSFILGGSGASNYSTQGYLPFKPEGKWYADGKPTELPDDFYSSAFYVDQMIRFHEEETDPEQPFFSYLAFQAVHAPLQAPREYVEKYRAVYQAGWDVLRAARFETAKALGIIPEGVPMTPLNEAFRAWDELSEETQTAYITDMAMMAGMLEAMDHHLGRYVDYLKAAGLAENTVFIITSDNGPDGGDYVALHRWATRNGFHRDFEGQGGKDFYGAMGPEFASAVAAPFSHFKYYTGEGGLRVPLVIAGAHVPPRGPDNTFCFITDLAPTIYDMAGLSTAATPGQVPLTGQSMLPHVQDPAQPIYDPTDGVGLEAASCSAYFLGDYKIMRNNPPFGQNDWQLYNLREDPTEAHNLASEEPYVFQQLLTQYELFARAVGVQRMPEGYSAQKEVGKKSMRAVLRPPK